MVDLHITGRLLIRSWSLCSFALHQQHMLVLKILLYVLLAPPDLAIACLHSVKRLAVSVAAALMHNSSNSALMQALHCMQQRKQ